MTSTTGRYAVAATNLALLQDVIRRDPDSYKEEFQQQLSHFEEILQLIELQPNFEDGSIDEEDLTNCVTFLSATSPCYEKQSGLFTSLLSSCLRNKCAQLPASIRMCLCKALMTMRNRGVADSLETLELCFEMVKCDDKALRKYICESLSTHITGGSRSQKKRGKRYKSMASLDTKTANAMQNYVCSRLRDSRTVVCRIALSLLIKAYRKNTWTTPKVANAIAQQVFHKMPKLQVAALKFLLGNRRSEGGQSDTESEGDDEEVKTMKQIMVGYKAGKKTKKREKQLERAKSKINEQQKKKKVKKSDRDCNMLALQQLHDPQTFAERLFRKLDGQKAERFEIRLLRIALLAQLIGVHELLVMPFYNYIQRFLQPQQRDVTRLLLYVAQSAHAAVPPDTIESVIRCIADNFVSDRNTPEAITVGLNSCTQILQRCPFAIDEDMLQDLTAYNKYTNANVRMAARQLVNLYRNENPDMLLRKDRARPTVAVKEHEPSTYGQSGAVTAVPGAEVLQGKAKKGKKGEVEEVVDGDEEGDADDWEDEEDSDESDDNDSDGWEEVSHSDDDGVEESDGSDDDDDEDDSSDEEDNEDEEETELTSVDKKKNNKKNGVPEVSKIAALEASETRIFDDEDYRKIAKHQLSKHLHAARKRDNMSKRSIKIAKKQRIDVNAVDSDQEMFSESEEESDGEDAAEDLDDGRTDVNGLPTLSAIERLHKKPRRQTKAERIADVMEGREGREKFGRPNPKGSHVGRTNKNIAKKKNFMMIRQKVRGKNRQRSFQERQRTMANHLGRTQKGRKGGKGGGRTG